MRSQADHPDPVARFEATEAVSLAFVTALQRLPPRQMAVLLLRDVLEFQATEVAAMLDTTVDSVNSALKRARAGVRVDRASAREADPDLVDRFVRAYETSDIDALITLLTDDAFLSMPPIALEYHGPVAIRAFFDAAFGGRRFRLSRTTANGGQPAFGIYLRIADGPAVANGLIVLTTRSHRVSAITRFDDSVRRTFGLPDSMP